jgi:hypothetical protein
MLGINSGLYRERVMYSWDKRVVNQKVEMQSKVRAQHWVIKPIKPAQRPTTLPTILRRPVRLLPGSQEKATTHENQGSLFPDKALIRDTLSLSEDFLRDLAVIGVITHIDKRRIQAQPDPLELFIGIIEDNICKRKYRSVNNLHQVLVQYAKTHQQDEIARYWNTLLLPK